VASGRRFSRVSCPIGGTEYIGALGLPTTRKLSQSAKPRIGHYQTLKGSTLDAVPHTLIEIEISDPARVYVIQATALPNPSWLRPGTISAGQQTFGDGLLASNPLVAVPSVVSTHSWNLLIDVAGAAGLFSLRGSEAFALDPRLNPVVAAIPRT